MAKFKARCVQACFFNRIYWSVGKIYEGNKKPPNHFELLVSDTGKSSKTKEVVDPIEEEVAEMTEDDESGGDESSA